MLLLFHSKIIKQTKTNNNNEKVYQKKNKKKKKNKKAHDIYVLQQRIFALPFESFPLLFLSTTTLAEPSTTNVFLF